MTTLPLLLIRRSADPGSDPDAFDHASEVYADWPDVPESELCERSITGFHQYEAGDGFERCVFCGNGEGAA